MTTKQKRAREKRKRRARKSRPRVEGIPAEPALRPTTPDGLPLVFVKPVPYYPGYAVDRKAEEEWLRQHAQPEGSDRDVD